MPEYDEFDDMRNQYVVYWEKTGEDDYGQPTLAQPVELMVYIEKSTQENINANSDAIKHSYMMSVDRDLVEGSIVWQGKKVNLPLAPTGLLQVNDTEQFIDDSGCVYDRWATLKRFSDELPALT